MSVQINRRAPEFLIKIDQDTSSCKIDFKLAPGESFGRFDLESTEFVCGSQVHFAAQRQAVSPDRSRKETIQCVADFRPTAAVEIDGARNIDEGLSPRACFG